MRFRVSQLTESSMVIFGHYDYLSSAINSALEVHAKDPQRKVTIFDTDNKKTVYYIGETKSECVLKIIINGACQCRTYSKNIDFLKRVAQEKLGDTVVLTRSINRMFTNAPDRVFVEAWISVNTIRFWTAHRWVDFPKPVLHKWQRWGF